MIAPVGGRTSSLGPRRGSAVLRLIVVAILCPTVAAPAAAEPTSARSASLVFASWFVRESKHLGTLYFVAGGRQTDQDPDNFDHFIAIGRSTCKIRKGQPEDCDGTGARFREISPESFEFDPLLRKARVRVRQGRFIHTVRWVGQGDYEMKPGTDYFGPPQVLTPITAHVGLMLARPATAKGRLFGRWVPASAAREADLLTSARLCVDSAKGC